ncbi:hypothetical protein O3P69_017292 [Scylla paramamosain]|uniref:Nucleoprotein TPR n=1 Tax=Scylla paramamosain TaxID=85552 RepID=A0AAW0TV48_SCYPA
MQSLKKETAQSQEEYAKVREEMAKLTETFEVEMNKAKESYAKLKDNFHEISKEKEDNLALQNEQNNELQDKLTEANQQLQEMQNVLKQKNEKIESLLNEKKLMLFELEKRVEDLQDELKEKETLLKAKADEYDSRTEELEAQMSASEDDLRKKLEDSFQEKHKLEQQLGELQHKLSEKDELAVRQAEDAEQRLTQAQQSFAMEREELENTWEQRLRNQGIADSLSANSRYVALLNMIKISCELDQLRKHHEEALASCESKVTRSHQAELEGVQSSYQHSVATRDATIAALKDEADQQRLAHQDDLEAWQRKYQDLESQLAEAKCQVSEAGVGAEPGFEAPWPGQHRKSSIPAMADSKLIIELEVKQVQEQLMKLFEERKSLQKEFEQLTGSSHQLLLEIKEDPTSASERKLHNYEAEKRRIEEKLELLENEISEKDKRITLLDSKAGLFLQQVSTTPTSNNLSNTDDKVEIDVIGNEGTSAVTVGEGGKSVEGARDGAHEVDIKCSDTTDVEVGQSVGDSHQVMEEQDHKVQECNHSESIEAVKLESQNCEAEVIEVTSPEEPHKSTDEDAATPEELPEPPPADTEAGKTTGMVDDESTRGEEKCKGQENHVKDDTKLEMKTVILVDDKESCSGGIGVEEEKSETATHEPLGNGVSDEKEGLNESEVQSQTEVGEEKRESQETLQTICNEPKDVEPAASAAAVSPGPVGADSGAASLVQGTPAEAEGDSAGKQTSDNSTPLVLDQVTSLSMLVAELRRVKDDMGKCMTVKEQSFLDLEDQLQAANKEVASLKASMAALSKDLEEKKQGYQALEEEHKKKKMDIELKIGEIQEVTNKCSMLSEEKSDLLRKMEVLEIMMTEYRTEIEMLVGEKNQMEQQTKQLLAAKTAATTAEAEIDSRTSVEEKEREIEELVEKIQSMEKEMKELNDKLKVTNRHLKVMAREREYKQKECEILKHKVEMVELKMCELQGTFDMLMKAVMVERDDLIKEMDVKNSQIDDLQQTVVRLKDTHEQELENVLYEKRLNDEELARYRSGEVKTESEKKALEEITNQKECLEQKLKEKTDEAAGLDKKVKTIHNDMTDFVNSLKDEMARIKDDSEKLQQEKANLSETFNSLQGEHKELQIKYQALEKSFEEVDKSNKEKLVNVESLKIQLDDLQKQLESVNAKNVNLSGEMFRKEEESREELSAREATIQELTVTLTNNQKQSMENYNALQQDMNNLQAKFKTSTEEHKKQQKELEERLKGLEKEKTKEINTLQEEIKSLKKELGDKNKKLEAAEKSKSSKDTKGQDNKDKEIEALNKKIEELTKSLEAASSGASKGKGGKASSKTDAEDLQQKVKDLTAELASLKKPESGIEASKSQEEFEASLEGKEKKIQLLESKVSDLEMSLANKSGYITQLEERIKDSPEVPNSAEAHLEQINKLSADISKLKEELKQTYEEFNELDKTGGDAFKQEGDSTMLQPKMVKEGSEQDKKKVVLDYEDKISSLIADYQEQISSLTTKYESKRVEENAEFGRVLVAKIDSYEKQIASQDEEINALRTEITKLQMDIGDKVKIIEELEANVDDMTLMRASLRAQVDDLKLAITKANLNPADQSCLDVLHAEYETRISEIQEYYEAQLNTLRSCLPETDVELQAVGCSSPGSPSHSQESEYSIELSCLRPFLQGQLSPAELRSQSAQDSHFSVFGDTSEAGNQASSLSSCLLARSPFDVVSKHEAQSRLSSYQKTKASKPSLHSQIKRKSILKAKAKCRSSSSVRHIVLDSASRSELRLLKSSLTPREELNPRGLPQTLAGPHFTEHTTTTTITTSIRQSFKPVTSLQKAQIQSSTEQYPPSGTDDQASAILSAMGAVPKPPCQATTKLKPFLAAKPKADGSKEALPAPGSSTTTALSSTTHPSDLDPNTTALDKYRIKVELSACCIPSAVIADLGWDSDSETSTKPSLPFFGDFRQLTILSH